MLIACFQCRQQLDVPEDSAGKRVHCPHCHYVIVVPARVKAGEAEGVQVPTMALPSMDLGGDGDKPAPATKVSPQPLPPAFDPPPTETGKPAAKSEPLREELPAMLSIDRSKNRRRPTSPLPAPNNWRRAAGVAVGIGVLMIGVVVVAVALSSLNHRPRDPQPPGVVFQAQIKQAPLGKAPPIQFQNPPPLQPGQPGLLHTIPWLVPEQGFTAHLWHTKISSDGRLLLAAGDTGPKGAIRIWELATGKQVQELVLGGDPWFHAARFLPGSKHVIAGYLHEKDLHLWDIGTGKVVRKFVGHTTPNPEFVVSPDGKLVLSWGNDKTMRLWDVETGKELRQLEGHLDKAAGVFSPDSTRILTFSTDKTLRLWDVKSGKQLKKLEGHTEPPSGCFSPDGKQALSYGPDETIRLWDLETGQEIRQFGEVLFKVNTAAFVADGKRVVAHRDDKKFRVWEAATSKLVHEIDCIAYDGGGSINMTASPDGRLALVGHSDGSVRVLDLATGKETHRYDNCEAVRDFAFSPDGSLAAAGSFRRGVFVFSLP
jgi:WD40 repeat protein/DNA-directed RNA polymerase subunit RPC12/RpoP